MREHLGLAKDVLLVGAIGNIRKAKGYDLFPYAAAEIKTQRQDFKFVVVG